MKQWIYLILFVFSFAISVFLNFERINIPYFNGLYKNVWVDVIYNENQDLKLIDINSDSLDTLKIDDNHYLYKIRYFKKIQKINIKESEKIKQIVVYVDKKAQFDNFDKIDNSKNIFDRLTIILLSFFYNFHLYLFSYIFLFLFLYNFKGKIKNQYIFWTIIVLALIFRLTQLNSIPFWDDEIYVLKATANYSPLIELFSDPGNPPLYFILFKIYRIIFQNPLFYRFSSVLIGIAFCIVFYLYLKKVLDIKTARTGLFFAAFNITLIYFSQEIRCYMLLMLLSILSSYFLFKKNFKGYFISSLLLLYTHFYGFFYFLYNSLFSIFYFKNKNKKDSFFLNVVLAFLYLPCIIFKLNSITSSFNSWIDIPKIGDYIHVIKTFSGYILIFIIFLILIAFLYKKSSKRKKLFIAYNFFAITAVVVFAVVFSYTIKPIFMYRYFYVVYPCYIALCAILSRNIILNIISFVFFTCFGFLGYQNLYCNHNLYLDFIKHNLDKTKNNYVFMTDTVENYKEFLIDNANPIYIQVNTGINAINPDKFAIKKPCICYILNLYLDDKTINEAKKIELYKTPLGVFTKVEY